MAPISVLIPKVVDVVIGSVGFLQIRVYLIEISGFLPVGDSELIHELRLILIMQKQKVSHIFYLLIDVY